MTALPQFAPMEARLVDALPDGDGWQFDPKWDGFRCLAYRDGDRVELLSKAGKPLERFFPEVAAAVRSFGAPRMILDGELLIALDGVASFASLQARLHPAESRIRKLSVETPARFMLFDLLWWGEDAFAGRPLAERRAKLEQVGAEETQGLALSPATLDRGLAQDWLRRSGGALDGVVAKRRDAPYLAGERGFLKVKQHRSADCVVGGFRYGSEGGQVGSLLLGLYDEQGRLDHVGFTSAITDADRPALTQRLQRLAGPPGFTGRTPGGPSRWRRAGSSEWVPLRPELVVEVGYDQVTDRRFRHGTKLLRWRPDKLPRHCTMEQLAPPLLLAELGEG